LSGSISQKEYLSEDSRSRKEEVDMDTPSVYEKKPWLEHYLTDVPPNIAYEETCLPEFLERMAQRYPARMALNFQGHQVSFAQLNDMVNRFAVCLQEFGIQKGDAVAILLPNLIPCVAAYYAAMRIGAITVMNNPLYSDRELDHQFNDSGAKVLVTLDLLVNRMIDLRPKTRIKQIVYTSIGDYLPFPKNLLFPLVGVKKGLAAKVKPAQDLYRWKPLVAAASSHPTRTQLSMNDIAMVQYTGGTTGVSKGVILTHGNLSKQSQQIASLKPDAGDDQVGLGALPFFHVFGLTMALNLPLSQGYGIVLVPKPQPPQLIESFLEYKPTGASLVPTMYIGMLQHPDIDKLDLSYMEVCTSGGAPMPIEIIKEFEERTGALIFEGYGLTEASPVTHTNPVSEEKRKIGSIGIPLPDTLCRIVDISDDTIDMPLGEPGELLIKGPQVMQGYWGMTEASGEALAHGWLHTGDIAVMDEDGFFFIVDRKKDMIIAGGYNIYPRDIEEVFYTNPKVMEATAIGIPHPTRGEAVKVFVALKPGQTATQQELIDYCTDKLAKYKWPTEIEFRTELPKTLVGKISKKTLREEDMKKCVSN
jgi:long-chain acyl-CoA synthetase